MRSDETGQPHTAHTTNPVPLIYVGERAARFSENGSLCDVAPSLLRIMDIPQPPEMTGKPLLEFPEEEAVA
jgi:2,3-bisphosphoglycerate-independent phosphoglycerate mutase